MPESKPTSEYKAKKLQRAFCDLHSPERAALEQAQQMFLRREGIPARMGDIVRGSIAQFCARQGVAFPDRTAREKEPKRAAGPQLDMWPAKPATEPAANAEAAPSGD